jgi:hypothetical protein
MFRYSSSKIKKESIKFKSKSEIYFEASCQYHPKKCRCETFRIDRNKDKEENQLDEIGIRSNVKKHETLIKAYQDEVEFIDEKIQDSNLVRYTIHFISSIHFYQLTIFSIL